MMFTLFLVKMLFLGDGDADVGPETGWRGRSEQEAAEVDDGEAGSAGAGRHPPAQPGQPRGREESGRSVGPETREGQTRP